MRKSNIFVIAYICITLFTCFSAPSSQAASDTILLTATGPSSRAYVLSSGEVLDWNYHDTVTSSRYPIPELVNGTASPVKLYVGYGRDILLLSNGQLYYWQNIELQTTVAPLAHPDGKDITTPTPINYLFDNEPVQDAILQDDSYYVLTESGRFFVWGEAGQYNLGTGSKTDVLSPTDITSKFGNKPLAAIGPRLAATAAGRMYAWGYDTKSDQRYEGPVQLTGASGVDCIYSALGTYLVSNKSGQFYTWGQMFCGAASSAPNRSILLTTGITRPVKGVSVGSCVVVTYEDGTVGAWGDNSTGLIDTDNSWVSYPRSLRLPDPLPWDGKVINAEIHGETIVVTAEDGTVWAWGDNQNHEVTADDISFVAEPVLQNGRIGLASDNVYYELVENHTALETGKPITPQLTIRAIDRRTGVITDEAVPLDEFVFVTTDRTMAFTTTDGQRVIGVEPGEVLLYAIYRSMAEEIGTDYTNPAYSDWVIPFTASVSESPADLSDLIELIVYDTTFQITVKRG